MAIVKQRDSNLELLRIVAMSMVSFQNWRID